MTLVVKETQKLRAISYKTRLSPVGQTQVVQTPEVGSDI